MHHITIHYTSSVLIPKFYLYAQHYKKNILVINLNTLFIFLDMTSWKS